MTARFQVVESIENGIEPPKPIDIKAGVLDVRMIGFQFCARLELVRRFFRNLENSAPIRQLSSLVGWVVMCPTDAVETGDG